MNCLYRQKRMDLLTNICQSYSVYLKRRSGQNGLSLGLTEAWEPVPVSGVENAAYYFSTYNAPDKVDVSNRKKIMVLGGGPNRIGQGIEFDYCCVHAAFAIRDAGYEINNGKLQSGDSID